MGRKSILPRPIRALLREIAPLSRAAAARGLGRRARAARDGRHFGLAAALYEEALRLNPHDGRMRVQLAHMLKEAGDMAGAEQQYLRAAEDLPQDADLALQTGHLYKLAGRPDRAAASYARALQLVPGWREAERELASVGGTSAEAAEPDQESADWTVQELLPRADAVPAVDRNILRLFRLGGKRMRSRWGDLKTLSGVEAIRGYRLAPPGLTEIRLCLDGEVVRREPLRAYPRTGDDQVKYVFNLWHDFSCAALGRRVVELGFYDASGRRIRRHEETVLVVPPRDAGPYAGSDAFVPDMPSAPDVEQAINARASMIRTVERKLLPDPVRTILVQRIDQLGDLVCSVPAIRRLRELFPDARLIGLVAPANATLTRSLGLFDEIVTVDFAESATEQRRILTAEAQGRLRDTLAPYAFDLAIDLGQGDESRPLLLLSGARFLYGFKDRQSPWLDAGLDFNAHDPANGLEIVPPSRKMVLLIEGLAALTRDTALTAPNADRSGLARYGIGKGERYAVLHAGARLAYTRWPHFDALIGMLLDRTGLKVLLFSDDAATAEKAAAEAGRSDRLRVIAGQIPFDDFDALLSHCALFVGNDSGPKHLAALRGAPVISLHMARLNWSEWGQEMSGRIISRRVPCAGCGIGVDGEDCGKDFACLRHIKPEEVFAAAQELLEGADQR
jgi:ADP-heptose:LPS heptosyltransferase/tetratricopeptide (TPR) repeat protein